MAVDLDGSLRGDGHSERIDPGSVPIGVLTVHRARYEFAMPYCWDKKVLDVACGAGYGSDLLAAVARSVTGLDVEVGAVSHARSHYRGPDLGFAVGDAMGMPFGDGCFDAVVSFETIEHLPDIEKYLTEVRRVLTPRGVYLVSTPRARRTTHRPANPYHLIEFSAEDFVTLLSAHFANVEIFGQMRVQGRAHRWLQRLDVFHLRRLVPRRFRYAVDAALGTTPLEEMQPRDQVIAKNDLGRAEYVVAVCGARG